MFVIPKLKMLEARLPATPCTAEMRERVVIAAKESGVTLAEFQRAAIAFFLEKGESQTIVNETIAIKKLDSETCNES